MGEDDEPADKAEEKKDDDAEDDDEKEEDEKEEDETEEDEQGDDASKAAMAKKRAETMAKSCRIQFPSDEEVPKQKEKRLAKAESSQAAE